MQTNKFIYTSANVCRLRYQSWKWMLLNWKVIALKRTHNARVLGRGRRGEIAFEIWNTVQSICCPKTQFYFHIINSGDAWEDFGGRMVGFSGSNDCLIDTCNDCVHRPDCELWRTQDEFKEIHGSIFVSLLNYVLWLFMNSLSEMNCTCSFVV